MRTLVAESHGSFVVFFRAVGVALVLTLIASVTAAEDAPLEGFGDVKLGMTEAQLKATHGLKPSDDWEGHRVYIDSIQETVNGRMFEVYYAIKGGTVVVIELHNFTKNQSIPVCAGAVDELAPMLAEKYGKFDGPPKQTVGPLYPNCPECTERFIATTATKTYPDRYLVITSYAQESIGCTLSVMYRLGSNKNSKL
jgi:hypothetical protein